jgi:hypothetical protein
VRWWEHIQSGWRVASAQEHEVTTKLRWRIPISVCCGVCVLSGGGAKGSGPPKGLLETSPKGLAASTGGGGAGVAAKGLEKDGGGGDELNGEGVAAAAAGGGGTMGAKGSVAPEFAITMEAKGSTAAYGAAGGGASVSPPISVGSGAAAGGAVTCGEFPAWLGLGLGLCAHNSRNRTLYTEPVALDVNAVVRASLACMRTRVTGLVVLALREASARRRT